MARKHGKTGAGSVRPEWSKAVLRLRTLLNLNQAAFGQRFDLSAMAVSRWERGISEPPSRTYIEMGNIAGDPLCWYFWDRAGLSKGDLLRVIPRLQDRLRQSQMPELEIVAAGSAARQFKSKPKLKSKPKAKTLKLVAIPMLQSVAASHGEIAESIEHSLLEDAPIESMIAAPKEWCPNPATTSCLRVKGNSMSPLIHDGYIVAVDFSQHDVTGLTDKIVIARHHDKGLSVSRLKRYDHTVVLQSENASYQSVTLSGKQNGKQNWKIIGKVLWWIGKAP
jgi:phage repressor protein C with HTH and peptisase S24 domain